MANFSVHSLAVWSANFSSSFHALAIFSANGSSGLGADNSAWMDKSTVRIYNAGLHLSFRISKQMRPRVSMLGW